MFEIDTSSTNLKIIVQNMVQENEVYYGFFYQIAEKIGNTKCFDNCQCAICEFCNSMLTKLELTMDCFEVSQEHKNKVSKICQHYFSLVKEYDQFSEIKTDFQFILDHAAGSEFNLKITELVSVLSNLMDEYVKIYHDSKKLRDQMSRLSLTM